MGVPNSRKSSERQLTKNGWARLALTLGIVLLAFVSLRHDYATAIAPNDPQLAYRLDPGDGRIAARLAEALSNNAVAPSERGQVDNLAMTALRRDPSSVASIATLGVSAWLSGDVAVARRLFAYSERLSRRNLRTQLWMIEDAVSRADTDSALRHYDISLRTSETAPDVLFPILASAISDSEIRTSLLKVMAGRPHWIQVFVPYIAGNSQDPIAAALLLAQAKRSGIVVPDASSATVIGRLIDKKDFTSAWSFYASIRPSVSRTQVRDGNFAARLIEPSPFDWVAISENGISATIQGEGNTGALEISAPPGLGGPVLRQLQMLPVGRYTLEGQFSDLESPELARPYWRLTCLTGIEIGRVVVQNSGQLHGNFNGELVVPPNCTVQYLTLNVQPVESISGILGRVKSVTLRPSS